MARRIFLVSLVLAALSVGLSQIPDPDVLGIHGEPEHIMFYGGLGLLAGFSALIAVITGAYLGITYAGISDRHRRLLLVAIVLILAVVAVAAAIRFYPS